MSAAWVPTDRLETGAAPAPGLLDRAELAAAFVLLVLMSGALLAPLFSPDQNPDSVPWLRTLWLPVYGATALMVARDPLRLGRVAIGAGLSLALVAWAFASVRWSIQPDLTLRRSVALLFTTLFGLHLAARYGWARLIELMAAVFLLLSVGTYIAGLLFPAFGVDQTIHRGAWKGLWYEKNQMGGLMAYGALVSACAAVVGRERRGLWIGGALLAAGCVALSQSTTALVGVAVAGGGMAGLGLLRRGGWVAVAVAWTAVAAAVVLAGVFSLAPDLLFGLIGKDATLTGRTDIWAAALHRAEVKPWLGYGFGAFWYDAWGPAWFIRHEVKWDAPTAHNGWLDLLLQLGAVGLVLAAAHFLISLAAAGWRAGRGPQSDWPILFMVLFGLFSVSESTLLQYNSIAWATYVAVAAKLFEGPGFARGPAPRSRRPVKLFPDS